MELRFVSASGQIRIRLLVCLQEFLFGAFFDWNRGNEIGVIDVEYDQVRVSTIGGDRKVTSLIGEDLTGDVVCLKEYKVGHSVVRCLCDVVV